MIAVQSGTGRDPSPRPARTSAWGSLAWGKGLPFLVSATLLGWLIWRVSLPALLNAAREQNIVILLPATLGLVMALYLWDAVALRWLFAQPSRRVTYPTALRARGTSYLASVFNYEVGQAALAWFMDRATGMGLLPALGRCIVLGLHDLAVLLTLGLIGACSDSDPRVVALRPWIAVGLALLLLCLSLTGLRRRFWPALHDDMRWNGRQSLKLYGLRVVYFGLMLAYAAGGLSLCHVALSWGVVLGVMSLVLLADALPVSVSGLGTRETTLLYLLQPARPEVILAWSLFWSVGLLVGRTGIGLANIWLGSTTAKKAVAT